MDSGSARRPKAGKVQAVPLRIEDVVPDPGQPRKTSNPGELTNLAQSIAQTGQISPIVVRPGPEVKCMIVVGERRWQAAREAGLSHVECIIRHDVDEQKAHEMQFAGNHQREDVPPLEQARSWKAYLEEYDVSQRELSRRTGIPQRTISDRLALLSLPMSVHPQIEAGEIGPYEAVKIAALPPDKQQAVAQAVSSGIIGGRTVEKLTHLIRAHPDRTVRDLLEHFSFPNTSNVSRAKSPDLFSVKPTLAGHGEGTSRRQGASKPEEGSPPEYPSATVPMSIKQPGLIFEDSDDAGGIGIHSRSFC